MCRIPEDLRLHHVLFPTQFKPSLVHFLVLVGLEIPLSPMQARQQCLRWALFASVLLIHVLGVFVYLSFQ